MISAWRIVQEKYSHQAFTGEGARLYGGRWNSPGVPMIYTSQTRALAALEMLVHYDSPKLLRSYLLFEVVFDEALMTRLDLADLPLDWKLEPAPGGTRKLGDLWVAKADSVVLGVPSTVISQELNFLLNPAHPDFPKLRTQPPQRFDFDPRLKAG